MSECAEVEGKKKVIQRASGLESITTVSYKKGLKRSSSVLSDRWGLMYPGLALNTNYSHSELPECPYETVINTE